MISVAPVCRAILRRGTGTRRCRRLTLHPSQLCGQHRQWPEKNCAEPER